MPGRHQSVAVKTLPPFRQASSVLPVIPTAGQILLHSLKFSQIDSIETSILARGQ